MNLFKKEPVTSESKPSNPVFVFDFGTHSLKILVCNYLPDKVEILAGQQVVYPLGVVSEEDILEADELTNPVSVALAALQDSAGIKVSRVIIGLGGLAVEGFSSQIHYRRLKTGQAISQNEFREILKKVEDRASQIIHKLIAWETAEGEPPAMINSEILEMSLDGYSVDTPVGSGGSKLSFTVYNSYTKSQNLKAILGLAQKLHLEVLTVTANMFATLRCLKESEGSRFSGVVLDIGAKTTEVGLLRSGRIVGHIGFDLAGESFTRTIASEMEVDFSEGEKLKLSFAKGLLAGSDQRKVLEVVEADCKVFLSGVELLLKEFPGNEAELSKIMLCGAGSLLPGILASAQGFGQSGSASPILLSPDKFLRYKDFTGRLNSPADIAVLAVAIDNIDLMPEQGRSRFFWRK